VDIELFTRSQVATSDEVNITTQDSTPTTAQLSAIDVHHLLSRGTTMTEVRTTATAITVRVEPAKVWTAGLLTAIGAGTQNIGTWATETAQQFGALLAALMGPAVFSSYVFALWSLADNLGWTDSFVFHNGPLSNWLIWLSFAILLNVAASILRRHTMPEEVQ
jgi:hypothetical protein